MEPTRISIIEDNKVIRDNVARFIGFHNEFVVITAHGSVESFLHTFQVETVRSHIKKLYKVLQVNNKTEAITKYMKGHIG